MTSSTLATEPQPRRLGDTFAVGVMVMLAVSVLQRAIGLLRGLGFCHFLSDVELGQWALANSFFVIGVPIAVLGLPGSFGKFVEYYRNRGMLGAYVRRVAIVSGIGLGITGLCICLLAEDFSWLVFGRGNQLSTVVWCVICLVCVAIFSFTNELVAALRQVRVVSLMQFTQSGTFAVLGLAALAVRGNWLVLLPCFAVASLVGALPGWWAIAAQHGPEFHETPHRVQTPIWTRILPYAGSLWLMNFLSNLFEVSDRYMLLHLTAGSGQAAVGQYHAAYILPNLLTSLALMLSGVLLPYLSADWEAERREPIAARLRQVLQGVSLGFTALAVAALTCAPLIYHFGFGDRYALAQLVLPLALVQATWISLFLIAETYLLCAEQVRQLAVMLIVALGVNLLLNWCLIEPWGLVGAVASTATANLCAVLLLAWRINRSGCHLGAGTLAVCLVPASLAGGPAVAMSCLLGTLLIAGRTNWLLSADDRQAIDAYALPRLEKCGCRLPSIWP